MRRSSNTSRGFLLVAAAAGLWVIATGVQADEPWNGGGTDDIAELTRVVERSAGGSGGEQTGRPAGHTGEARNVETSTDAGSGTGSTGRTGGTGRDAQKGKAADDATEETGTPVPTPPAGGGQKDADDVSRVPVARAAPPAPGLPEDAVIQVPDAPDERSVPVSLPELSLKPVLPVL